MPHYQDAYTLEFVDWSEAQEKARKLEAEGELYFIFQGKRLKLKQMTQYILTED